MAVMLLAHYEVTDLDRFLDGFDGARKRAGATTVGLVRSSEDPRTLVALIEFAWTGIILLLDKTDLQGWTSALIRRMMFVGAFFALLQFGTTWIPAIIDSFVDAHFFSNRKA